jgi:hypothetical protein
MSLFDFGHDRAFYTPGCRYVPQWHSWLSTHPISDFYVTCASVIPVLFLAVAVQGRAYESVVRALVKVPVEIKKKAEASDLSFWALIASSYRASAVLLTALAILVAGGVGEVLALQVLYTGSERPGQRLWVFVMTLLLLAVVIVGPALALWRAYTKLTARVSHFRWFDRVCRLEG